MSPHDEWQDDTDPQAAGQAYAGPVKPRMSTGVKVLLFLLCGGGVCALLCCGVSVYLFQQGLELDRSPEAATAAVTEIVPQLEVPESFAPQAKMAFTVPFTDFGMLVATFARAGGKGMLIVSRLNIPTADAEQLQQQFEQQLQQGGKQSGRRQIRLDEVEKRVFEIDGQPVTFHFGKGTDSETRQEWRQVSGTLSTADGLVLLVVQVEESDWDEAEVVQMLTSLGPEIEQPADDVDAPPSEVEADREPVEAPRPGDAETPTDSPAS